MFTALSKISFKCECSFLNELDIEDHSFKKKYIKVCTKHAEQVMNSKTIKEKYKFSKKKQVYVLRDKSDLGLVKLRSVDSNTSTEDESVVSFGKHSGKQFKQVYEKDKAYCLNILRITNRKNALPKEMFTFSEFVKNSLQAVK